MEQTAGVIVFGWKLALALVTGIPILTTVGVFLLARFTHAFDAYAGERAKLLAQFHNLDRLVEQTKTLTATTETIKAKVSDELWDRQMRFNLKRDFYFTLIKAVSEVYYSVGAFAGFRRFMNETDSDSGIDRQKLNVEMAQRLDELHAHHEKFMESVAVGSILLNSEVYSQLQSVASRLNTVVLTRSAPQEELDLAVNEFGSVMQQLIESARADLGFAPLATLHR